MLANNSILKLPPSMWFPALVNALPEDQREQKEGLYKVTSWRGGRQEELTKAADTCAIRWCCRFITRDTAICMLPNTATTSKILSSKEGAVNVCHIQGRENLAEAQLSWRCFLYPLLVLTWGLAFNCAFNLHKINNKARRWRSGMSEKWKMEATNV